MESKGVQFPSWGDPEKINRGGGEICCGGRGGKFAVTRDSSKISASVLQEHHIRMYSEEHNKWDVSLVISYRFITEGYFFII